MKNYANFCFAAIASTLYQLPVQATAVSDNSGNERPNLLVIMADQFRGDAFSFRGKEAVKTPHFDSFAREAVVCTQAVSGYPVSSPAEVCSFRELIRTRMELLQLSVGISRTGC